MPTDPPALASINGIGPQRAELLAKLGMLTHDDLLHYVPRRHEDRRHLTPLSEAQEGAAITVRGKVHQAKAVRFGSLRLEATVAPAGVTRKDDIVIARWYAYRPWGIKEGCELFLFGRLSRDKRGHWVMKQPEYEIIQEDAESFIHIDRVAPVYGLTDGLTQRVLRRIMFEATQKTPFEAPEFYPAPPGLMPRQEAFRVIHFPDTLAQEESARQRLAYDEFFVLQCVVAQRRLNRVTGFRPRGQARDHDLSARWLKTLPFPLTGAQQRVMADIDADLRQGPPMNRLLQGDVGAGKTFVAIYAMLRALEAGEQAALMAPTQILAEQHALNLRRWLEPLGVRIDLFTGNTKKKADRLRGGELDLFAAGKAAPAPARSIVIGTHALLYDRYAADQLGLIVIDEQHKFGVLQRLALSRKGKNPDILVMTATPIPRTLGMTVYGDLDVSVLDELPPGRQPIVTKCRGTDELDKFWIFLRKQVDEGRQAYVVYPLVEDSDKVEAKSVKAEFERLKGVLPGRQAGAAARPATGRGKGAGHDRLSRRDDPGAARHLGHRGRRRCAERDADADRECGTVRPGATAPVARAHRPRRARLLLRAGGRAEKPGELAPAQDHGGDQRRFPDRGGGLQDSRAGQHLRDGAERAAATALRQPGARF